MTMKENETGFIKLYRSFLNWEWHDDQSMVTVFLHCILLANWKPKQYHGESIPRGTFITSIINLASTCGLAPNTVRTCLKRLQNTGELTVQTSRKGTKITVNNYANYQIAGGSVVQNMTHELNNELNSVVQNMTHDLNNELNTTKNRKKERSIKKYIKKVEVVPDYYNAEPIRDPEPVPATQEEIERTRELIMKGTKNESV